MSPDPAVAEMLSLAVDHQNRYSGEAATYFIRFQVPDVKGAALQLSLPKVMKVESFDLPSNISQNLPSILERKQEQVIRIPLGTGFTHGEWYQVDIQVRIRTTLPMDQYLVAEAVLVSGDAETLASESVQVAVFGKSKALQYLPELYFNDDFTSRFLMLFESFWKPITKQIDQMEYYFDPDLTPPEFVPWLASWLGLPVDESLPIDRVRILLKKAIMLYQYRGTYQALKTYLEIYTAGEVEIEEQRARNFVLGRGSTLGVDVALGTDNRPNSIIVNLRLPESELERNQYSQEMYHRKIIEVIRAMVPAHTSIRLTCDFYAQAG